MHDLIKSPEQESWGDVTHMHMSAPPGMFGPTLHSHKSSIVPPVLVVFVSADVSDVLAAH